MVARTCDVVVIGGGEAGTYAAELLTNARRNVIVLDGRDSDVTGIAARGDNVDATCADGSMVSSQAAILATGTEWDLSIIDGLESIWGTHAFPDTLWHLTGYSSPVVAGSGDGAALLALDLARWTTPTLLLEPGDLSIAAAHALERANITVIDERVTHVREYSDGIEVTGVTSHVVGDCLFVRPPQSPRSSIARDVGCRLSEDGHVLVDQEHRTSVAPVYAAGSLVFPPSLDITSSADGIETAISCHRDMLLLDARMSGKRD